MGAFDQRRPQRCRGWAVPTSCIRSRLTPGPSGAGHRRPPTSRSAGTAATSRPLDWNARVRPR